MADGIVDDSPDLKGTIDDVVLPSFPSDRNRVRLSKLHSNYRRVRYKSGISYWGKIWVS